MLLLHLEIDKNSAIADKPRDTFVQYAMEWLMPQPKNTLLTARITMPNFIALGQAVRAYVWRTAEKTGPIVSWDMTLE